MNPSDSQLQPQQQKQTPTVSQLVRYPTQDEKIEDDKLKEQQFRRSQIDIWLRQTLTQEFVTSLQERKDIATKAAISYTIIGENEKARIELFKAHTLQTELDMFKNLVKSTKFIL